MVWYPVVSDTYNVVYNSFAKKYLEYFPEDFKDGFPKYEDVVDLSFLKDVQSSNDLVKTTASITTYSKSDKLNETIGKRQYNIEFALGSANLTPEGQTTVGEIYNQLIIANATKIELQGHTDSNGSETVNQPLSEARAKAVKAYLQSKSASSFPDERFIIHGFGSTQPIADNSTKAGQAQNRRVTVVVGH